MALSSEEHDLLVTTCDNMNVAANTCRDVLEMLRSLGSTGVVDIATHNNAADAHANVATLAHISEGRNLVIGTANHCNSTTTGKNDTNDAYREVGNGGFYKIASGIRGSSVWSICNSMGYNYAALFQSATLEADTNGNITSPRAYKNFGGISSIYSFLENSSVVEKTGSIMFQYGGIGASDVDNGSIAFLIKGSLAGSGLANLYYFSQSCIAPLTGITASLGRSSLPFDTAYLRTAATVTSDRREKSGISALGSEAVDFIKALRPVQYTVKNGRQHIVETDGDGNATNIEVIPGTRRHWGLIAQEVQEALVSAGYEDAAVWCLADKDDPDSKQSLRYEELIAPMIKVIQMQQERIEALERKVA